MFLALGLGSMCIFWFGGVGLGVYGMGRGECRNAYGSEVIGVP